MQNPPIPFPASELLPVMERDRIFIAMIIMEVVSEFIQAYRAAKAPRQRNHTERMASSVINCAAILDDPGFFDVPRGRNDPPVVLAGTRHGDYSKRKLLKQVIHRPIVTK